MSTPDSNSSLPTPDSRSSTDATLSSGLVRILHRLRSRVPTWPAYLLAVCWPGAGHWYRCQWARGCSWAALSGAALLFLSSGALIDTGAVAEPLVVNILRRETVAFGDVAVPLAVLSCNVLDLYGLTVCDNTSSGQP